MLVCWTSSHYLDFIQPIVACTLPDLFACSWLRYWFVFDVSACNVNKPRLPALTSISELFMITSTSLWMQREKQAGEWVGGFELDTDPNMLTNTTSSAFVSHRTLAAHPSLLISHLNMFWREPPKHGNKEERCCLTTVLSSVFDHTPEGKEIGKQLLSVTQGDKHGQICLRVLHVHSRKWMEQICA